MAAAAKLKQETEIRSPARHVYICNCARACEKGNLFHLLTSREEQGAPGWERRRTRNAVWHQLIFSGERPRMSQTVSSSAPALSLSLFLGRTHASILNVDADCFRQSWLLVGWMCFVNAMNKMNPEIEPPVDLLNKRYMKLETRRARGFSPQQPEFYFKLAAIVSRARQCVIFHAAKKREGGKLSPVVQKPN